MTASAAHQAFFLPASPGQRFCVLHPATGGTPRGLVVFVHPFAEEMNKARRMAALQARILAAAGHAVLQIDLLGCGDSSGDFGDASWQAWVDDVLLACRWLRAQHPEAPLWLWGLRAGCLIAAEAGRQLEQPCHFIFWQAPASGKLLLQQFLRLKMAGELLDGNAKGAMEAMRTALNTGEAVEIAGYSLAPALARGLEAAQLSPPTLPGKLLWLELSTRPDATFTPVSTKALDQWRHAGFEVFSRMAEGPSFWQTTEIEDAPALLDATMATLNESLAA